MVALNKEKMMKTIDTDLQYHIKEVLHRVHGDSETLFEVIDDIKEQFNLLQKDKFHVGDIVNIVEVQKNNTKKTTGVIKQINKKTANVRILSVHETYRVPFSMLEK